MGHATLRMNLALSGAPEFAALSGAEAEHRPRSAPSPSSRTRATDRGQLSRRRCAGQIIDEPYLDIRIPSAHRRHAWRRRGTT